MKPHIILEFYIIIMNILAYISMGLDKRKAIKHQYRIPEKTLFLLALLGGSLGSILGMKKFHHKTKHWYFKYGMPLILCLHLLLGIFWGHISKSGVL